MLIFYDYAGYELERIKEDQEILTTHCLRLQQEGHDTGMERNLILYQSMTYQHPSVAPLGSHRPLAASPASSCNPFHPLHEDE